MSNTVNITTPQTPYNSSPESSSLSDDDFVLMEDTQSKEQKLQQKLPDDVLTHVFQYAVENEPYPDTVVKLQLVSKDCKKYFQSTGKNEAWFKVFSKIDFIDLGEEANVKAKTYNKAKDYQTIVKTACNFLKLLTKEALLSKKIEARIYDDPSIKGLEPILKNKAPPTYEELAHLCTACTEKIHNNSNWLKKGSMIAASLVPISWPILLPMAIMGKINKPWDTPENQNRLTFLQREIVKDENKIKELLE